MTARDSEETLTASEIPSPALPNELHAPAVDESPIRTGPLPLVEVPVEYYRVEGEQGRGGIGVVLRARDQRLDRVVALKQLQNLDSGARARFEREMRITARLQHPGVVPVHETGRFASGEPFYAMKLVEGRSLKEVIGKAQTLAERLALVPQVLAVAETIAYAHSQRVIHRDLKPSNVIVGAFGETVVIDWGLAKVLGDAQIEVPDAGPYRRAFGADGTSTGAILGTPAYMPPEQARGSEVDHGCDVYAIGAMLYHVLTGNAPYAGTDSAQVLAHVLAGPPLSVRQRAPDVPADLAAIVARSMARRGADRYASAAGLADDLRAWLAGRTVAAHAYTSKEHFQRWTRRHAGALVAAGVVAVLAIAGLTVAFLRADAARRVAESETKRAGQEASMARLANARSNLSTSPARTLSLLNGHIDNNFFNQGPARIEDARAAYDLAMMAAARPAAMLQLAPRGEIVRLHLDAEHGVVVVQTKQGRLEIVGLASGVAIISYDLDPATAWVVVGKGRVVFADARTSAQVVDLRSLRVQAGRYCKAPVHHLAMSSNGRYLYCSNDLGASLVNLEGAQIWHRLPSGLEAPPKIVAVADDGKGVDLFTHGGGVVRWLVSANSLDSRASTGTGLGTWPVGSPSFSTVTPRSRVAPSGTKARPGPSPGQGPVSVGIGYVLGPQAHVSPPQLVPLDVIAWLPLQQRWAPLDARLVDARLMASSDDAVLAATQKGLYLASVSQTTAVALDPDVDAEEVTSLDLASDGSRGAVGHRDGDITLWDLTARTHVRWAATRRSVVRVDLDGDLLASADAAGAVLVWRNPPRPAFEHRISRDVVLSLQAQGAAVVGQRQSGITTWRRSGKDVRTIELDVGPPVSRAYLRKSGQSVLVGGRSTLTELDTARANPSERKVLHTTPVVVAASQDESLVVVSGVDGTLHTLHADGSPDGELTTSARRVVDMAVSSSGLAVALVTANGELLIVDVAAGSERRIASVRGGARRVLALPKGDGFFVRDSWGATTVSIEGAERHAFFPEQQMTHIAVSNSGPLLAAALSNGVVVASSTNSSLPKLKDEKRERHALLCDGPVAWLGVVDKTVVAACGEGTLMLWDPYSGRVGGWMAAAAGIAAAAATETELVVATADGWLQYWPVPSPQTIGVSPQDQAFAAWLARATTVEGMLRTAPSEANPDKYRLADEAALAREDVDEHRRRLEVRKRILAVEMSDVQRADLIQLIGGAEAATWVVLRMQLEGGLMDYLDVFDFALSAMESEVRARGIPGVDSRLLRDAYLQARLLVPNPMSNGDVRKPHPLRLVD